MNLGLSEGDLLCELEVGPVAHGGHCVARTQGRVIFVRHGLPGEIVDAEVTEVRKRYARAEVVRVHRASPHRVEPACPIAGRCGGCDFQHVEPAFSRELKRRVVAELLDHLAGIEFTGEVYSVDPDRADWRTRMRYHLDAAGRPGLLGHRSREIVLLPPEGCRIADERISRPPVYSQHPGGQLLGVATASTAAFATPGRAGHAVTERVGGRQYRVALGGFWQPHRQAASTLVAAVLAGLQPAVGEVAADLYCGVGLFAGALADAGCRVWGIEGDRRAVALAVQNVPEAEFIAGDVAKRLARIPGHMDLVVLDPPRTGAGPAVLSGIAARRPRAICYVACDPAALARDLRSAAELGYRTTQVSAYDLFPLTHHVECVAVLEPA